MRFKNLVLIFSSFVFLLFTSCSKQEVPATHINAVDAADATAFTTVSGDTTTLTLQPNAANGQDAYVNELKALKSFANSNYNNIPELGISAWTVANSPLKQRVYIRFTGLNALPKNAKILSATIFLYGLDPNTSASAPQGNSLYPGSPYNAYTNNGCYISLVSGGAWRQDSITWNNKPDFYATANDGVIPSSDKQWNYDVAVNITSLLQIMVNKHKNNGFCIHLQNEAYYRCVTFASSEAADAAKHPKIVVKYIK